MGDDPDIPEREMKDFQFRQTKKIRVFDTPEDLPRERSSLLAISNKYGVTFVGQDRTLKVFLTEDIIAAARVDGNTNDIVENVKCQDVIVDLPMHHLALCSDELTLSVCGASEDTTLTLDFYDVRTFLNTARPEKKPFASLKPAADLNTTVQDLKWSPVEAFTLALCLTDGSMMVLDVKDSVKVVAQLPAAVGITCVCWSPKGKQVAAGKQDGTVVQYTPTLQEKKVIPCPNFYTSDNPVKVLDVLWLSTYNFTVVYAAADGALETPPEVVVVTLPKKDERKGEKFVNFSEMVYGTCSERQHHFFLNHIEDWYLILASSAASIEVNILAKQEDKINWELWALEDQSRAELPVTLISEDTLPVGVGIDYTNLGEIQITNEKKLPPVPTLLILSTDGVLCPFSLLNLNPGAKQLVRPAVRLPLDGERPPLAKSVAPPQAPAVSKPSIFPSFQIPSTTAPSTSAPLPPTAAAAPISSAFPSTIPAFSSSSSSTFPFGSLGAASSAPSAFPSSSSFSFAAPKSSGDAQSASSFSFSSASLKPPTVGTSASVAAASPVGVPKVPAEPATPNVRVNLNDRFKVADTPAAPASAVPPFSFTSTPKPAAVLDSSSQPAPKPQFSISKPAAPAATRPAPAQSFTPAAAVHKPASAPAPGPAAPSATQASQSLATRTIEKQLQQKKDLDPVMIGIKEEIAHFQKEMDDLKARINRADFQVGSSEEMRELRKESDNVHEFTLEIKETTESVHGDISVLKTTLLEAFAGVEEARAQSELNKDQGYLQLLYKKPLDPRSEQQLKEIRRLYQYVKFAVEDVNDVLDLEWEKHLEKKRKQRLLIVPEREALYTALANNMDIINQQKQKLDQLAKDLQSLRLYNKTSVWNEPTHTPSTSSAAIQELDSELESLKNAWLKASLGTPSKTPSKSPSKMTPVKQAQLRSFLSKRQTPPVRSTAPANLSKSAFLFPKYEDDLDDTSSTSSLSHALEPEESLAVAEEEDEPTPLPPSLRHLPVMRTTSIQPGFSMESTAMSLKQGWPAAIGGRALPKINMDSADSTALATKTVKHGPIPVDKTTPAERSATNVLPASQAAARAALNRQMNSQKPVTSLTEATLKTVPQVVNVLELKDKGPAMPGSTQISSSVPASTAQALQQVLAGIEATKNSSQNAVRAPPLVINSTTAQQPGSVVDVSQMGIMSRNPAPSVPGSSTISPKPPFQPPKPQEETLGPFSGLKVGQAEEVKEPPKNTSTFLFSSSASGSPFTFVPPQPKPAPADSSSASASADAPKNPGLSAPPASSSPSSSATSAFSFTAPSFSAPSFTSPLVTPPESERPSEPEPSPPPESTAPEEASSGPSSEPPAPSTLAPSPLTVAKPLLPSQPTQEGGDKPPTRTSAPEVTQPTGSTPAQAVPVTAPVQETAPATTHTPTPAQLPPPAETTSAPAPVSTTPGSIFTQPAVSTSSTTLSVTSFTPVICTAASTTTPASVFGQPASTSSSPAFGSSAFGTVCTSSTFGKPVFGQPAAGGFGSASFSFNQSTFGGDAAFGQTPAAAAPAPTSTPAAPPPTSSSGGGGGSLFGSATSSSASTFSFAASSTSSTPNPGASIFGQSGAPAFGQSSGAGFGQESMFGSSSTTTTTASASGFSFTQPTVAFSSTSTSSVFGQQQSSTSVFGQSSSSGGLFGSAAANNSSSSGGGFFSGLGGKPSEDAANKNPFGSTTTAAFGQTNQTGGTSLFGNSGAKSFVLPGSSFGEQKPGGTFSTSAGASSVAAQGFGSFSTPAKTGGFGSAPVFGSPPAFSGSPAFGGSATFGSAPAFSSPLGSSPSKVFGEGTAASNVGGFGFSSPSSGPSFGSLANQNGAPTFGSLAQQGPAFGAQSGGGFSGFGSPGGFGGFGSTNTNQSTNQTFGGWRS